MARAKQPVSIGGIEFDALIDQKENYEAEAPEYPTEKGFSVSDTIVLKPETLSMTLIITDTPVTWRGRHGTGRVQSVISQLKAMYFSKKMLTVVTSDAVYDNMALIDMSISKSSGLGYAREVPITLKKIIVTETATAAIPASYGKSGTTGASAGTANIGDANSGGANFNNKKSENPSDGKGQSGSILYNAAHSLGWL